MKELYVVKYDELLNELSVDGDIVWWAKPIVSFIVIIRMISHWLLKDDKNIN